MELLFNLFVVAPNELFDRLKGWHKFYCLLLVFMVLVAIGIWLPFLSIQFIIIGVVLMLLINRCSYLFLNPKDKE